MSNQPAVLLSNPGSTKNIRRMDKMRRTVARGSNIIHIELDGIESMPEALRQAARCNPRVLIISGGDGTVQSVLTTLADDRPFRKNPPLAVLPSGKTNLIAADLGMRGRPETLFKQLVEMSDRPDFRKHLVQRR
ncbi:MAG: acylglycerol kinase family protein, partial [Sphingomonadales bacterium]